MKQVIKEAVELEAKNPPAKNKWPMFSVPPDLKVFLGKRVESVALQLAGKEKGFEPSAFGFPFAKPAPPPGAGTCPFLKCSLLPWM